MRNTDTNQGLLVIGDGARGTSAGDWSRSDKISAAVTLKQQASKWAGLISLTSELKYTVTWFRVLNISCTLAKSNYRRI